MSSSNHIIGAGISSPLPTPEKNGQWGDSQNPKYHASCGQSAIHTCLNCITTSTTEITRDCIKELIEYQYSTASFRLDGVTIEMMQIIIEAFGFFQINFISEILFNDFKNFLISTLNPSTVIIGLPEHHAISIIQIDTYKDQVRIMEPDNFEDDYEWISFEDLYEYLITPDGLFSGIVVSSEEIENEFLT